MILPALEEGGYTVQKQVHIGSRLGCGKHVVDVLAEKDSKRYLVSLKWQQTGGTAEQKVPYEVICLGEAVTEQGFAKAYLVLGGEGWTLRGFFVDGGLSRHLTKPEAVSIVTLESFVAKANKGKL
ncbi:MAG: hypothetical protein HYX28_03525 [Candidatus Koribacter versatilis]|uniref:PD-(D/E)XK nuclease domain-containing protein n=1 Tax=Candidatus Korobacter versatilis TaxID=658062 RepID=A0A932A6Y6_9BACT|nr:hypothetical protein [Candidatus Koribacter versatilis]